MAIRFDIEKRVQKNATTDVGRTGLMRVGKITTPHGVIETPAFIAVGTKATVKALTPEQVAMIGAHAVLANTYHLYLQPGHELVAKAGGFAKFMHWNGPTFTDSGGFQVFSLGAAFGKGASKISDSTLVGGENGVDEDIRGAHTGGDKPLAVIDEEGVTFKSVIDGSTHRFTPERSMEIQHALGADIFFAFDECTSPHAPYEYQKEAIERTHRWAKRCVEYHNTNNIKDSDGKNSQALFGVVQGGRFEDLRKESARQIASLDVDGFGIGGSFDKEDMDTAVGWVNSVLPENKPRHLLGIGEPIDIFGGIENGVDTFDCVSPTRVARNGSLYTTYGRINIMNAKYTEELGSFDPESDSPIARTYSGAYIAHLFRAHEMLGATLASIHNLYFIVNLVKKIRQAILDDRYDAFKKDFLEKYYGNKYE